MGKIYIKMPQKYICWEFFGIFFSVFFCFAAVTSQQQTDCYYKEVKLSNSSSVNVTDDGEHVTSSSTSCVPCRKCPDGFFERRKCTESHDAECQACGNKDGEGHGNEDYLTKCFGEGIRTTVAHDFPEVGSGDEPVSSGDSSPLDNVLPVFPTKVDMPGELPPISGGITIDLPAFPRDNDTTTAASLVFIKEVTPAEASFQVWWIILIVLLVLIVCFVIFIVARKVKKRKSNDLEQTKDVPDGTKSTVIDMNGDPAAEPLANGNHPQKSQDQAGENTPMMPASVNGTPNQQRQKPPSYIYRPGRKPKKSALKKAKSFGGSTDFRYIDEDSEDEMVKHCGRPPSSWYKDSPGKNRRRSFIDKLRGAIGGSRPRAKSDSAARPPPKRKLVKQERVHGEEEGGDSRLNTSYDAESNLLQELRKDEDAAENGVI